MNHKKIYDQIISRGKLRGLDKKILGYYTEKHHIKPRCLGGSNDRDNLVLLTGREHFICHVLLYRIFPHEKKLLFAWQAMAQLHKENSYIASWQYASLREALVKYASEIHTGMKHTEETKRKVGLASKGRNVGKPRGPMLESTKQKLSQVKIGHKLSEQTKKKMSESKRGSDNHFYGKSHSEEIVSFLRQDWNRSHGHLRGKPMASSPKVRCIETGSIYDSIQLCAEANNVCHMTIRKLIESGERGYRKCKGLSFKLA